MQLKILEKYTGLRVDIALSEMLNISRSVISKNIQNENILLDGKSIKSSYKINGTEIFECNIETKKILDKPNAQNIDLKIEYEDEYLALINKPYNMVVHPTETQNENTLVNAIMYKFDNLSDLNENGQGIVHRLDKDTSGLIIIAKDNKTHEILSEMFKNHEIDKIYLAILKGKFTKKDLIVESYIGRDKKDRKKISENTNKGRKAISIFTSISYTDKYTLAKVKILTGRTHQIRVHSKKLGLCIAGDSVYGSKDKFERQQLHSYILEFAHPITKKKITVKSQIPKDMKENMQKLGLELIDVGV